MCECVVVGDGIDGVGWRELGEWWVLFRQLECSDVLGL